MDAFDGPLARRRERFINLRQRRIVHATGGLNDSVVDCTPETLADRTATGFKFFAPTADALLGAIERGVATYGDRAAWQSIQRNGMARDFSWKRAAQEYATIYRRLVPH